MQRAKTEQAKTDLRMEEEAIENHVKTKQPISEKVPAEKATGDAVAVERVQELVSALLQ